MPSPSSNRCENTQFLNGMLYKLLYKMLWKVLYYYSSILLTFFPHFKYTTIPMTLQEKNEGAMRPRVSLQG